jgi:uncharacterized repeat protein (TIGR01451 family)
MAQDRRSAGAAKRATAVSLEIIAPTAASAGVQATYELIVHNHGDETIEHARVEAEIPEGSEYLAATPDADVDRETATWVLDRLEPGAERRIELRLKPQREGTLELNALVTCATLCAARTDVTRPQLALTMTAPREAVIGQVVPFVLHVANPGTGPATGVVVRDLLPVGMEHPAGDEIEYEIGTLGPGETRDVQLELLAKAPGNQTNHAEVTGDGDLRAAAEAAVQVLEPQLALKKTGPKRRYLERPATYSLVVSNPGTTAASNISVVDEVPDGVVLVQASDGGRAGPDKKTVRWTIDQLEAGESITLAMTVRPTVVGEYCTLAVATADGDLRAEAEICTAVEGISALLLEVVDLADPIEVGADTTYELRVVNQGTQAATNVVIRASAPRGMRPVQAEAPTAYEIKGQEIIFEPLPRLGTRADAAYHIRVRGERAGDLRFRVSLECDQLEAPVNKEESTRVYSDE